jgi:hypothetical protein
VLAPVLIHRNGELLQMYPLSVYSVCSVVLDSLSAFSHFGRTETGQVLYMHSGMRGEPHVGACAGTHSQKRRATPNVPTFRVFRVFRGSRFFVYRPLRTDLMLRSFAARFTTAAQWNSGL